ncbi:hypothetical protein R1sor_010355 [Riccia sorocarpa]|uniref:Uncharacterized protein n=1 Tax=Riccia sorocarpa TaxID=122646 RepID=A0ABD3HZP3_9MARC
MIIFYGRATHREALALRCIYWKRKADDIAEEGTTKKPRNVKAKPAKSVDVNAMQRLPKKEEEKLMKTDFNKFMLKYPFGTDAVFPISVEKIMEAPSIYVYRSVNENYILETFRKMIEKPHITPQIADLLPFSRSKKKTEDVLTLSALMAEIWESETMHPVPMLLEEVADYKSYVSGFLDKLEGYSKPIGFRFSMANNVPIYNFQSKVDGPWVAEGGHSL